jgi:hypothetical protein
MHLHEETEVLRASRPQQSHASTFRGTIKILVLSTKRIYIFRTGGKFILSFAFARSRMYEPKNATSKIVYTVQYCCFVLHSDQIVQYCCPMCMCMCIMRHGADIMQSLNTQVLCKSYSP